MLSAQRCLIPPSLGVFGVRPDYRGQQLETLEGVAEPNVAHDLHPGHGSGPHRVSISNTRSFNIGYWQAPSMRLARTGTANADTVTSGVAIPANIAGNRTLTELPRQNHDMRVEMKPPPAENLAEPWATVRGSGAPVLQLRELIRSGVNNPVQSAVRRAPGYRIRLVPSEGCLGSRMFINPSLLVVVVA